VTLDPWTPAREDALRSMWAAGLSASQIAGRLGGTTRNAVIGKCIRLKLPRRATTSRKRAAPRARPGTTKAHPPRERDENGSLVGLPLPEAQPEDIARIATLDLEPWHCRWPCVPDPLAVPPGAAIFCGSIKLPALPYCEVHAARAFAPVETRRVDRALRLPAPARADSKVETEEARA
jgi:GcrA cell cycle regulator